MKFGLYLCTTKFLHIYAPTTVAFLMFLEYTKYVPAFGSLHLLFLLPRMLFPRQHIDPQVSVQTLYLTTLIPNVSFPLTLLYFLYSMYSYVTLAINMFIVSLFHCLPYLRKALWEWVLHLVLFPQCLAYTSCSINMSKRHRENSTW